MYLAFLAVSCAGFSSLAAREFVSLNKSRQAAAKAVREVSTMLDLTKIGGASSDGKGTKSEGKTKSGGGKAKPKKGSAGAAGSAPGREFWDELGYLLRVAVPGPLSNGGQLLAAQFALLVMRTLITVRANKVNTFYLTKAISQASWQYWVRWFVNFGGWMVSGVVVNSGLRYVETLIYLELR